MPKIGSIRAFSLTELTVSMAVFCFVLLCCYTALSIGNGITLRDATMVQLQSQVRNAMARVVREARQATSMTVSFSDKPTDSVVLSTPKLPNVLYYVDNGILLREYPLGRRIPVAVHIKEFKMINTSALVEITITAQKSVFKHPVSFSLREKIKLRN